MRRAFRVSGHTGPGSETCVRCKTTTDASALTWIHWVEDADVGACPQCGSQSFEDDEEVDDGTEMEDRTDGQT